MQKRILRLVCVALVVVVAGVGLSGCVFNESPAGRIQRLTGIKLPKDKEVVYSQVGQAFVGLAPQYTIFRLEEHPTSFLQTTYFSEGVSATFVWPTMYFKRAETIATEAGNPIPEIYQFDMKPQANYLWYVGNKPSPSGFSMVFFPDELLLAVLIHGH